MRCSSCFILRDAFFLFDSLLPEVCRRISGAENDTNYTNCHDLRNTGAMLLIIWCEFRKIRACHSLILSSAANFQPLLVNSKMKRIGAFSQSSGVSLKGQ